MRAIMQVVREGKPIYAEAVSFSKENAAQVITGWTAKQKEKFGDEPLEIRSMSEETAKKLSVDFVEYTNDKTITSVTR